MHHSAASTTMESSESAEAWLERHWLKWSMAVGVVSSNILLLYFLLVGCCVVHVGRGRERRLPDKS
jgi:hypothetical protein